MATTPGITNSELLSSQMTSSLEKKSTELTTQFQGSLKPLLDRASTLTVSTAAEVVSADALLYQIRAERKAVAQQIEEQVGGVIRPIREGLDKLYAIRRGIEATLDKPLAEAEKQVKTAMADYRAAELRQIEKDKEEKRAADMRLAMQEEQSRQEQARLAREAEQARAAVEQAAGTDDAVARLRAKAAAIRAQSASELAGRNAAQAAEQRAEIKAAPVSAPVKVAGSKTVVTKKWKVADLEKVVRAVAAGKLPALVVMVDKEYVDKQFKEDRAVVDGWAEYGIVLYDEVTVAGR